VYIHSLTRYEHETKSNTLLLGERNEYDNYSKIAGTSHLRKQNYLCNCVTMYSRSSKKLYL